MKRTKLIGGELWMSNHRIDPGRCVSIGSGRSGEEPEVFDSKTVLILNLFFSLSDLFFAIMIFRYAIGLIGFHSSNGREKP